ncbi:hypothetical protein BDQ12DRAFT_703521 [Crucibulum laeve]|uniref:ABC transporter domain-containing protein n=1 Tax=Crucibulum laeve TaxID=68775 RepID=A0A5C3MBX0_9AGAR|nr:hypothetical protein BDQ12DRAFT_703521 [Crucibulum laeve]
MGLFWRQFSALFVKNWIVISRRPVINLVRFLLFPLGYGIFLAYAQIFFDRSSHYGLGTAVPILPLKDVFNPSRSIVWVDNTGDPTGLATQTIMSQVTRGFSDTQLNSVHRFNSTSQINSLCVTSFNGASPCFVAISFDVIPNVLAGDTRPVSYTIRTPEMAHVDVIKHDSDVELSLIPIQWAVNQAIIQLVTATEIPTPNELPFTTQTTAQHNDELRRSYLNLANSFVVLAFLLAYIGIAYQLSGAVALERSTMLTNYLKVMGLMDSARIISWHISTSLIYMPAWLAVAGMWKFKLFTGTHWALVLGVHLLLGLGLASWSLFVSAPFGKSPQLASIFTSGIAIAVAVVPVMISQPSNIVAPILSFCFPSMFYVFVIKAICGFELSLRETDLWQPDPRTGLRIAPLLAAAALGIFVWPCLAAMLEHLLYGVPHMPGNGGKKLRAPRASRSSMIPPATAISIRHLSKVFKTSMFRSNSKVTAVDDLSLDIPKYGIYVLLGPNGAGKSTTLSILAGLTSHTKGSITFEGGASRPAHGTIGIVPQKDVLFPDLTCLQNLRVWRAVKAPTQLQVQDDLEELLRDCDLQSKIHANADTLSGGQKRKLQLAAGLVGGSEIVLVDECTSGVDPLSRRALWKTLTTYRSERTIVLTTHFLDEADFLADHIAMMAAPGKLVAEGTPVALKSTFGDGYSIVVNFTSENAAATQTYGLLKEIRTITPDADVTLPNSLGATFILETKDISEVARVLVLIEAQKAQIGIASYDVLGASIEDVFLDLTSDRASYVLPEPTFEPKSHLALPPSTPPLELRSGKPRSPVAQALTIFHKRSLIVRRSWLAPFLAIALGVLGAWWPLRFIGGTTRSCIRVTASVDPALPLFPPSGGVNSIAIFPPNILNGYGLWEGAYRYVPDNATFMRVVAQQQPNKFFVGGVSLDVETGNSTIAWIAEKQGIPMFNLASNMLFNLAVQLRYGANVGPVAIVTWYQPLPRLSWEDLLSLRWVVMFGTVMAIFPAVCALYVSKERQSSVQAMQFSNGLANPLGLWLGHLLFDSIISFVVALGGTIIFVLLTEQIRDLGIMWFILLLYGLAGTLFAYLVSTLVGSPLAAVLVVGVYQFLVLLLYLTSYIAALNYIPPSNFVHTMTIIHFMLSFLAPIASLSRATLLSINQFTLLCVGENFSEGASRVAISRYGGPILYLFLWIFVLLFILSQVDSGSKQVFRKIFGRKRTAIDKSESEKFKPDVASESVQAVTSNDVLRVLHVSKSYNGKKVVDDVSMSVGRNSVFAMLGPNGAGKTTTFNIIRGKVKPDSGDVVVNGTSAIRHTQKARLSLGFCPQFSAVDSQLSVREHLMIYGRLKGLNAGHELNNDINALLNATGLNIYANRLANKLSGGNQRKLSLAIALIGNPSVVLVDEFSTGIDAGMKRELWKMLKRVVVDKSVLLTTHSMEEASALATKVGIMAKQMLAVGTPTELESRYGTYEVQFSCRTRPELLRIQTLMSQIPGSRMTDDVATRFEVSIGTKYGTSLAGLFDFLSRQRGLPEFMVSKATLESAFLKVVREHGVQEEDSRRKRRWVC